MVPLQKRNYVGSRYLNRVIKMWGGRPMAKATGNQQRWNDRPAVSTVMDEFLILVVMGIGAFTALLVDFFVATGVPVFGTGVS